MSSPCTVHLTLPHWDGGSRKFRFLYLVDKTSFRLTDCFNEGPVVPLFLGADLFSITDIRVENHPRYHAKFAKKGLATKITFSTEFRFQGLTVPIANNSLWFYSIQGLFRVAFELYTREDQLGVLENLQNVWKSQINDSPLDMTYTFNRQLDSAGNSCAAERQEEKSEDGLKAQPQAALNEAGPCSVSADHNYCAAPEETPQLQSNQLISAVTQAMHNLGNYPSSKILEDTEHLETIQALMECVTQCLHNTLEEKNVIETVLALLRSKQWGCVYSSHLLNAVGQWLGQQFHRANGNISQRVEGFKLQHIERISDLPPAEELAAELFPEAMRTLLLHWMGLSEDSSLEKRRSEYPIFLLILEFANHNLITGVAHVLYSSLICK